MFKLTKEQINYIIAVYGGSKQIIKDIEHKLNLLGVVSDENDYFEIIAAVAAQKETIKEQIKKCATKDEILRKWISTNQLIKYALNEKYNNFINSSEEVQQKIKNFC